MKLLAKFWPYLAAFLAIGLIINAAHRWDKARLEAAHAAGVSECQQKQAEAKILADSIAIEEAQRKQQTVNRVSDNSYVVNKKLRDLKELLTQQAINDAKKPNSIECFDADGVMRISANQSAIRGSGQTKNISQP